jgi:hypothetical protein
VDVATQEQLVSLIDDEIAEIARCDPARPDALNALLDLRLRVSETAAFEWIEREVRDHAHKRGSSLVSLMRRSVIDPTEH